MVPIIAQEHLCEFIVDTGVSPWAISQSAIHQDTHAA